MARRLTEEQITKLILSWLKENGWKIICFDFPQSGTGCVLRQNPGTTVSKNKGTIIPDIVAVKEKTAVFFENKDHVSSTDIEKVSFLRSSGLYSDSIEKLLEGENIQHIYYGIGIPLEALERKPITEKETHMDFIVTIDGESRVVVDYDAHEIFVIYAMERLDP